MKKLFGILFFALFFGFAGYYIYINYFDIPKIDVEEERVNVDEYYIYGNHFLQL